jgi:uncharacterized protein (TIGR03435 family)
MQLTSRQSALQSPPEAVAMIRQAVVLAFVGGVAVASAQAPAPAPLALEFEVASVRRNTSGDTRTTWRMPPTGSVSFTNATIRWLIVQAYDLPRFTLVNASDNPLLREPDSGPKFDVQAKPPDDAPPGQQRLMLQRLLADRFNLRARREKRTLPIYALTVAREGSLGPELRPSVQNCVEWAAARKKDPQVAEPRDRRGTPLCAGPQPSPTVRLLRNAGPAAGIARQIQAFVDRPLVDATGLTGNVEWTLTFAMNPLDPDTPSIFTAVEDQLGLKLEPRMSPNEIEVLVVDSVELPTAN